LYRDEKKICSWFDVSITACPPFRDTKDYCTVLERLTVIICELREQQCKGWERSSFNNTTQHNVTRELQLLFTNQLRQIHKFTYRKVANISLIVCILHPNLITRMSNGALIGVSLHTSYFTYLTFYVCLSKTAKQCIIYTGWKQKHKCISWVYTLYQMILYKNLHI
jgi:hypothetical protein